MRARSASPWTTNDVPRTTNDPMAIKIPPETAPNCPKDSDPVDRKPISKQSTPIPTTVRPIAMNTSLSKTATVHSIAKRVGP